MQVAQVTPRETLSYVSGGFGDVRCSPVGIFALAERGGDVENERTKESAESPSCLLLGNGLVREKT